MAFVPSKSVHKHGVQDVTSEFVFMMNHIVNSCFAPPPSLDNGFLIFSGSKGSLHRCESNDVFPIKMNVFFIFRGSKGTPYIEANRMTFAPSESVGNFSG